VATRSIDSVMSEIRRDLELGATQLLICDETFVMDKEKASEFCGRMIKEGISEKVNWICETRVDTVSKELLKQMAAANCFSVGYGIESGNQEILDKIKKGITLEQARNAVAWTKEAGIRCHANFIIGLPFETRKTIMDTINFAIECDPDFAMFSIATPLPGSEMAEMAEKGVGGVHTLTREWSKYSRHISAVMELDSVKPAELEALQAKAFRKFYLRPGKLKSAAVFIRPQLLLPWLMHRLKAR